MILGITGGTGCGKTTLLQLIRQRGGLVLDCDERSAAFTAILGGIVIAELALWTNFHKHTSD